MCGIVTYYNPAHPIDTGELVKHYLSQRHRGTQGFGFTYTDARQKIKTLRFETEAETFHALGKIKSHLVMFHHRMPTSTVNKALHNHPITRKTPTGIYTLVHNGVISNDDDLKADQYAAYPFETEKDGKFNDSECLLHSMVDVLERKNKAILATGSVAFVLLKATKTGKATRLYFGRNDNPLFYIELDDGTMCLSSTFYDDKDDEKQIKSDRLYNLKLWENKPLAYSTGLVFPRFRYASAYVHHERKPYSAKDWEEEDEKWKNWRDETGAWEYDKKDVVTTAPLRTPNLQEDYIASIALAKELIEELKTCDVTTLDQTSRALRLNDIDSMVSLLISASLALHKRETALAEELRKTLHDERTRFLAATPTVLLLKDPTPLPIIEAVTGEGLMSRIDRMFHGERML